MYHGLTFSRLFFWLCTALFVCSFGVDFVSERAHQDYLEGCRAQVEVARLRASNYRLRAELDAENPFSLYLTNADRERFVKILDRALDKRNRQVRDE